MLYYHELRPRHDLAFHTLLNLLPQHWLTIESSWRAKKDVSSILSVAVQKILELELFGDFPAQKMPGTKATFYMYLSEGQQY